MSDPITQAVVVSAENVPGDLLLLGAAAVERASGWSKAVENQLFQAIPASDYKRHAELISHAWAGSPDTPGIAVASAIRAAVAAVTAGRAANRVSLVWTGPPTRALGLRSTRAVLSTIVAKAERSLLLVSFASYRIEELVVALVAAVDRGVEVTFVLETRDDSGGDLSFDAADAFAALRGRARFYHWPLGARRAFFAESARLHAKCVVADRSTALVTSANLTSAGINDNIELGALIEAGLLPETLHRHFDLLIEEGVLEPML